MGVDSHSWKAWAKSYVSNVTTAYLDFAVPVAIFLAFNIAAAANASDPEKTALLWLHYTQTPEEQRDAKFPSHEGGKRRKPTQSPAPAA